MRGRDLNAESAEDERKEEASERLIWKREEEKKESDVWWLMGCRYSDEVFV